MTLPRLAPQRLRAILRRRHLTIPRAHSASEAGDTLIEVVLAVVVIALTAAALLGAVTTSIVSSASHRYLSTDDTLLRSYAEQVEYQLEQSPTPLYAQCAQAGSTGPYSANTNSLFKPNFPVSGYQLSISSVQYWGYPMQLAGNISQGASVSSFPVPALQYPIAAGTTVFIGDQEATVGPGSAALNATSIPVENALGGPFVTDAAYSPSTWLYVPGWYSVCSTSAFSSFPGNDLQELTITVTAPTGVGENLEIVVRDPTYV
jgi:Tfp pilus assembly protein PilV